MTQQQVADVAKKSRVWVTQLEGESRWRDKLPPYDDLRLLAKALRVPITVLAGETEAQDEAEKTPRRRYTLAEILDNIGAWPVVSNVIALDLEVSAGKRGGHIPQGLEGAETLPKVSDRQLYALRVTGDCMHPEVKRGDTVIFDPARPAEDGDMVVATKDGEKALVKWLDNRGTVQRLLPLNGDAIVIDDSIDVIGVVEDIQRKAALSPSPSASPSALPSTRPSPSPSPSPGGDL